MIKSKRGGQGTVGESAIELPKSVSDFIHMGSVHK